MFTLQCNNAMFSDQARTRERITMNARRHDSNAVLRDAPLTTRDTNTLKLPPFRRSHTHESIRVIDYCFLLDSP